MRVSRKGAVCGGGGDLSELFFSLSLSLQILKRFKKNSCYCASLPSSYIPIFPPPPLTPLNYITINQNSEPTSLAHSFLVILSSLLFSAHHFFTYHHHHDGSPEYLGTSGNLEHREMGSQGNENPNSWMFDEYNLMEDISVTSLLDPTGVFASTTWPSPPPPHLSFSNPTSLSMEQIDDSFPNSDGPKEISSRKRVRSGSCTTSGSKACREKMRRDRLNDRFMELGSILDPERPPKMDKSVILGDAVRMLTQLRDEAQKLKESKMDLQEKINELKAEKNELRDEKQRLKVEKENLEKNVKALSTQPGFLPHPPAIPAPFSAPGQVVGSKLVPFMGYPGVSMWQFMPPASVDTSQDHVLRPPVA